ncbi:hypothetical protein ACI79J_04455 [Geodermatophilus sp. SYSU D01062]
MATGPSVSAPPAPGDDAVAALEQLVREIDRCAAQLQDARTCAEQLLSQRRSGDSWLDIVTEESRPLVVERITTVLGALAGAGSTWRRAQARALQAEQVSINRIAAMFGVTRQRISALLRDQPGPADRDGATA